MSSTVRAAWLLVGLLACARHTPAPTTSGKPRLLVFVVVDQLPVRLLDAARPFFTGGLARLTGPESFSGVARYPYAVTVTAAGHATLSTGTTPSVHGIAANTWWENGAWVRCCTSATQARVPLLGDRVREAGGEVVALSLKRRGAVLLSAAKPTLAAGYDTEARTFEGGASDLLSAGQHAARMAEVWTPLRPDVLAAVGRDDAPWEGNFYGLGTTFPHDPRTWTSPRAFLSTPAAGGMLTDAALAAVDRFDLGLDDQPDLLSISYSNIDYIGHSFTPESWESLDAVLRLDQDLGRLFASLDTTVGAGRYSVLLSSDHGAPPAPHVRIDADALEKQCNDALAAAGIAGKIHLGELWIWLPDGLDAEKRALALETLLPVLRATPGIAAVYPWAEPGGIPGDAPYGDAVRLSAAPGRSGDLFMLVSEGDSFDDEETPGFGTKHGSPYAYDQRVPFLLWGAGVKPGHPTGELDPRQAAPTAASLLGLLPPEAATMGAVGG